MIPNDVMQTIAAHDQFESHTRQYVYDLLQDGMFATLEAAARAQAEDEGRHAHDRAVGKLALYALGHFLLEVFDKAEGNDAA